MRWMHILGLSLLMVLGNAPGALATPNAGLTPIDGIIELNKPDGEASGFLITPKVETLDPRFKNPIQDGALLAPEDDQNLTSLWQIILGRNPIIQFGLKQIATPPELRYAHESVMSKTIGGLLNGAAILPMAMGASQYASGASAIGANVADRALSNTQKVDPSKLPSDTELVELAGLIQDLQKNLLDNYFGYKNSLESATELQLQIGRLDSTMKSTSLASNPLKALWAHQQYDATQEDYRQCLQSARLRYLALEHLVGVDGMRRLRFGDTTRVNAAPPQTEASTTGTQP